MFCNLFCLHRQAHREGPRKSVNMLDFTAILQQNFCKTSPKNEAPLLNELTINTGNAIAFCNLAGFIFIAGPTQTVIYKCTFIGRKNIE